MIDGASAKEGLRRATNPQLEGQIFIDASVNFDVYHRLIRRRLGVDSSFTSGVRVRTTTTCTPSATIKTSRRTVVVHRAGRPRSVAFLVAIKVPQVPSSKVTKCALAKCYDK